MFFIKSITTEQVIAWIQKNFKNILFLLVFFVAVSIAFMIWNSQVEKKTHQLQNQLYKLQKSLHVLVKDDVKKEEINTSQSPKKIELKEEKSAPLLFTKEMKQQALVYESAILQNQKQSSVVAFAIDLADFYYRRGELMKAKKLLSSFAFPKKKLNVYHLASFQLASYYMSEKKCEEALSLLSDLSQNKSASFFYLESELQQAFCLEQLKRYDQALHKYEDIINKDVQGYTGRLAQDYKKLLIINRKLKNKSL